MTGNILVEEQSANAEWVKDINYAPGDWQYDACVVGPITPELLKSINDKWELIASYSKAGQSPITRAIPFIGDSPISGNRGMFDSDIILQPPATLNSGGAKTSGGSMAFYSANATVAWVPTAVNATPVNIPGNTYTYRNFPLPIRYRGDFLQDEEETVIVDLFWTEP